MIIAGSVVALGVLGFIFRKPLGKIFSKGASEGGKILKMMADDVDAKDVEKLVSERKAKGYFIGPKPQYKMGEEVIVELKDGYKQVSSINFENKMPVYCTKLVDAQGTVLDEIVHGKDFSGLVRTVFDDAGRAIKQDLSEYQNVITSYVNKFNSDGQIIRQKCFYTTIDKPSEGMMATLTEFEYSVDNGLSIIKQIIKDDEGKVLRRMESAKKGDKIMHQKVLDPTGKKQIELENEYDLDTNTLKKTKETRYNEQEKVELTNEIEFNQAELPLRETLTDSQGSKLTESINVYDKSDAKKITESINVNYEKGEPAAKRIIQYAEGNKPARARIYSFNTESKNFEPELTIFQNYDNDDNLINIITRDKLGNRVEHGLKFKVPEYMTATKYKFD